MVKGNYQLIGLRATFFCLLAGLISRSIVATNDYYMLYCCWHSADSSIKLSGRHTIQTQRWGEVSCTHQRSLGGHQHVCIRCRAKKTSKLRVTGLCEGNSPGPVNSPHKGQITRKMFPFDDVIMLNKIPHSLFTDRPFHQLNKVGWFVWRPDPSNTMMNR